MLLSTFQALLWNHTNSIRPAWLEDCVGIVAFCKTGIRTPSRNCLLLVDCRGWHHCDHFHHLNHHYNHNLFLLLLLFRSFLSSELLSASSFIFLLALSSVSSFYRCNIILFSLFSNTDISVYAHAMYLLKNKMGRKWRNTWMSQRCKYVHIQISCLSIEVWCK